MPYIKQQDRDFWGERGLDELLKQIKNPTVNMKCGDLNYIVTKLAHAYVDVNECYQSYNDVIGALEGAKLEFYRRREAFYEDKKIKENGDIES